MIDDIIIDLTEKERDVLGLMFELAMEWGYTAEEIEEALIRLEGDGKVRGWFVDTTIPDMPMPMIEAVQ